MFAAILSVIALVAGPNHAAAFMLPSGAPLAKSYSSSSSSSSRRSPRSRGLLDGHSSSTAVRASWEPASTAAVKQMRRTSRGEIARVMPLLAASVEGDGDSSSSRDRQGSKSLKEPVLYAQEVLDRAWRSKRRIAAQRKGKPLKQRLMNAFGQTSAVFVDDREFMEETLDNVLRVSRAEQSGRHTHT